jgi:anti-sigma factor RsiW
MCEYSGRLIAWLDRELPDEEATNVEWHVGQCAECRSAVSAYEEVSGAFLACYEAACKETAAAQPRRKMQLWKWGGVAAAAAILAIILLAQPTAEKLSVNLPSPPHAPAIAFERLVPAAPVVAVRPRHAAAAAPIHAQWNASEPMLGEPMVQVALPADALFPPGAVPEGFSFIADVRFQQ